VYQLALCLKLLGEELSNPKTLALIPFQAFSTILTNFYFYPQNQTIKIISSLST
jgi:hypothetical protein